MKIHVTANLILTVPEPKKGESVEDIMLLTEQHINDVAAIFTMPETKTKVGIRIHVQKGKEIK